MPYEIVKGEDPFTITDYKGKETITKRNLWVVMEDEHLFPIEPKQFKTLEKALEYCVKQYIKTLNYKLKEIQS